MAPGPGEVAITVHAAGVNFPDVLIAAGRYQVKPPLPFTLGAEIAGTIAAVGADVHDLHVGQRVATLVQTGGYAEIAVAPAATVIVLPASIAFETAAAMVMTYGTAYHALVDRGRLQAGDRVVVTGAGGGVGTAAVDIASGLDARVVAVVGSEAKREAALHAGAMIAVAAAADLTQQIKDAHGATDILLDNVGGDVFDAALRTLDWRGRALIVGFTSGRIPEIPANRLLLREADALGVFFGTWSQRHPAAHRANFTALLAMCDDGRIRPRAHERVAFDDVPLALEAIAERRLVGKAVVTVRT
ncbi:NADPH:quinone oxidoreductase family protein [Vulcanimicrobium alpinum]|uniref:NADPH:quinone oxidoreductase family protein n=1 Tax=Vulcanimicrobium alpinum TaxID=3016050 RepID=UPI00295EF20B|nr:NADPH:quinone oxidoreductase family protein [Vulcanimicrobium alpinum]